MLIALLALVVAAAFAGAAVYVIAVEQPARLQLDDRALLTQWKPAYHRGTMMQASLAMLGGLLGLWGAWQTRDGRWLGGGIALLAAWPYTLLVIRPTNRALLATPLADAGAASRRLIVRWARLHAGRVALGGVATVLYAWAACAHV